MQPTFRRFPLFVVLLVAMLAAGPSFAGDGDHDHEKHHGPFHGLRNLDLGSLDCDELEAGEHGVAVKRIQRGRLGVELTSITPELRRHFGVPEDEGVLIGRVVDDSSAFRAGLQVGDIVTRVGGETIHDSGDLSSAIRGSGGETVDIEVWRDGKARTLSAAIELKESCTFDLSALGVDLDQILSDLPQMQIDAMEITEKAMAQVRESLEGVDWQQHMERIQALQGEDFELRMEELHKRMEELQRRLEVEYEHYGEEIERAMEAKERALEAQRRALEENQDNLSKLQIREHEEKLRAELERAHEQARQAMQQRRDAMEVERRAAEAAAAEAAEAAAQAAAEAAGESDTL